MVRLKLVNLQGDFSLCYLSQFHYGSIKTKLFLLFDMGEIGSQFHYGSIKTDSGQLVDVSIFTHLNSTMVRLKPIGSKIVQVSLAISIPLWFD